MDRIYDSVLIRENTGQRTPVFLYILHNGPYFTTELGTMDIYFINFQIFVLKHLAGKRKQCPKLFWRYYVKLIYMLCLGGKSH